MWDIALQTECVYPVYDSLGNRLAAVKSSDIFFLHLMTRQKSVSDQCEREKKRKDVIVLDSRIQYAFTSKKQIWTPLFANYSAIAHVPMSLK